MNYLFVFGKSWWIQISILWEDWSSFNKNLCIGILCGWTFLDLKNNIQKGRKKNKTQIFLEIDRPVHFSSEDEAPIHWPPDAKNWLIGNDSDVGNDWRQEEKWMMENEMVEWHHWLNGQEFEQALGVGNRQWSLVCCSPWDCKELDMTELLNWEFLCIHFSFLLFLLILTYRVLCFQLFSYLLPCWRSEIIGIIWGPRWYKLFLNIFRVLIKL